MVVADGVNERGGGGNGRVEGPSSQWMGGARAVE